MLHFLLSQFCNGVREAREGLNCLRMTYYIISCCYSSQSSRQLTFSIFVQLATVMLLISGALVNGPYALITTAVSADLVSLASPLLPV